MLGKLRIIEFAEGIAGPMAAVRLADLGADVVKIESAEGDWMRQVAPVMAESEMAAAFFELNRGKQSLALGPAIGGAHDLLKRLVELADVVITDRTDADLEAMGIRQVLREGTSNNPGLIVVDISP